MAAGMFMKGIAKSDKRPKQVSILKPVGSTSGPGIFDDDWDVTPLIEGAKFNSYEALSRSIDLYCKEHGVKLFRSDSRTLRSAPNRANPIIPQLAPEQLIYYSLTYSCVYGGKSFRNFSKAKQPCKFFVRVNITRDYQQLEVSKICDPGVHNHDNEGMPATPSSKVTAPRKRYNYSHITRPVKQGKQSTKLTSDSTDIPGAEHLRNVFNTLHCYQKKGLFCDTLIITKTGMVYAHSVVLAAISPTLYSALNQQPFSNRQPNVIDLSDCNGVLVSQVLDFFYSGQVYMPNAVSIKQICARLGVILESKENELGLFPGEDLPEKENIKDDASDSVNNDDKQGEKAESKVSSKGKSGFAITKKSKNGIEKLKQKKLSKIEQALLKANVSESSKSDSGQPRVKRKYTKSDKKGKALVQDLTTDDSQSLLTTDTQSSQQSLLEDVKPGGDNDEGVAELKSSVPGRRESSLQFRGFLKSLTQQPQYPCKQCCRVFKREMSLNTHMWKHWTNADGAGYTCSTCDAVVAIRRDLRKHSFEAHGEPLIVPHQCTVCNAKFLYRTRLWRHMTRHIDSTVHVCDTCDRWHNVRDFSEEHCAVHKYQHSWTCGMCGKRCVSYVERIRHELWAHRRGAFKHDVEKMETSDDFTLDILSDSTRNEPAMTTGVTQTDLAISGCSRGRRYVCGTCGVKFDRLSAAAAHRKVHTKNNDELVHETHNADNLKIHADKNVVQKSKDEQCETKLSNEVSNVDKTEDILIHDIKVDSEGVIRDRQNIEQASAKSDLPSEQQHQHNESADREDWLEDTQELTVLPESANKSDQSSEDSRNDLDNMDKGDQQNLKQESADVESRFEPFDLSQTDSHESIVQSITLGDEEKVKINTLSSDVDTAME